MTKVVENAKNKITWGYKPGVHNGVDIGYSTNEEHNKIYANCKGTVEVVVTGQKNTYPNGNHGWGNYVRIKHSNGWTSLYAHLSDVYVKVGQSVDENTCIALMGNTGYSTGRHLHFEVKNSNNVYVEPTQYLDKPIYTEPKPEPSKNKKLYLPADAETWRVYDLNVKPITGNEKGFLLPSKFGGLEYDILGYTMNNVAIIQTRDFGKVQIYVAPETGAVIR